MDFKRELDKKNDVKILTITGIFVPHKIGEVFGLGDDYNVYWWCRESAKWIKNSYETRKEVKQ